MTSPFPSFPVSGIVIPSTPLIIQAAELVKSKTDAFTYNHSLRTVAFALLIMKKFPPLAEDKELDTEAIVIATMLHDMGWVTEGRNAELRFEVDGANMAREFIQGSADGGKGWDKHRTQLVWDAIALHTTPNIGRYKEKEVFGTGLGIMADFFGPDIPIPSPTKLITPDEFREIIALFPRLDFKNELRTLMCQMCAEKQIDTVSNNFVGQFGEKYGYDGKGKGIAEFKAKMEEANMVIMLEGALHGCAAAYE